MLIQRLVLISLSRNKKLVKNALTRLFTADLEIFIKDLKSSSRISDYETMKYVLFDSAYFLCFPRMLIR